MTVVITGAAGTIGSAVAARLPAYGWTVRLFDRVPIDGGLLGDITVPADLDAAMDGASAVVHLAGVPTEVPWPVLREANIDGTIGVFEAARRNRVPRIIYASSIHAAGFTLAAEPNLPADTPARPDTLYGVSKVFGEALGRYYADRYGLQVACLRIGTFAATPPDRWALSNWLSPDDCGRLVDACLRSARLGYALVWGISANTRRTWSLDEGYALGYQPRDDAEDYADSVPAGRPYPSDAFVGGGYTSPGFGIDEVAARS
ncbi:MAG: NAD(P)-dependent oxidoreductase [Actinomycetota bacterium]|nr:NAD(P)-dependent oxidoreductase [Actinomycetota bacterium]